MLPLRYPTVSFHRSRQSAFTLSHALALQRDNSELDQEKIVHSCFVCIALASTESHVSERDGGVSRMYVHS